MIATSRSVSIPSVSHYWIRGAHVPRTLLTHLVDVGEQDGPAQDERQLWLGDDLLEVDLEIEQGLIRQCLLSQSREQARHENNEATVADSPTVELNRKLLWPCFVDMHTHLDKGHIWERTPNRDRTFAGAITAIAQDGQYWTPEDLYRRMTFGLKCSYAHGTSAIRTHLDAVRAPSRDQF